MIIPRQECKTLSAVIGNSGVYPEQDESVIPGFDGCLHPVQMHFTFLKKIIEKEF